MLDFCQPVSYYYTSPGLSWDSFLKYTDEYYMKTCKKHFEVELITDMDSYILYLDANNLYGHAMCEYLPQSNFKWNTEEWDNDRILNLRDDAKKGCLFDVNLHYPKELHDLHNGYALGPENKAIKKDMLNTWQQDGYKESSVKKLITSFSDKKIRY